MVKRVTITMPDSLHKQVRKVQTDLIPTVDYSVSFSGTVTQLLKEALKKKKR